MTNYLLSIYQPDGPPPAPEVMEPIMQRLSALNEEMKSSGAWVFTGPLHAPDTATVLRARGDDVVITDGPYLEGKEYIGGFWVIAAADLDEAMDWGRKAAAAIGLPIEVRPFVDQAVG